VFVWGGAGLIGGDEASFGGNLLVARQSDPTGGDGVSEGILSITSRAWSNRGV
jgi:hypothetical protein